MTDCRDTADGRCRARACHGGRFGGGMAVRCRRCRSRRCGCGVGCAPSGASDIPLARAAPGRRDACARGRRRGSLPRLCVADGLGATARSSACRCGVERSAPLVGDDRTRAACAAAHAAVRASHDGLAHSGSQRLDCGGRMGDLLSSCAGISSGKRRPCVGVGGPRLGGRDIHGEPLAATPRPSGPRISARAGRVIGLRRRVSPSTGPRHRDHGEGSGVPSGASCALLWRGAGYGLVDTLLLTVFPCLVAYRLLQGHVGRLSTRDLRAR